MNDDSLDEYYDEAGGFHFDGIGYSPNNKSCGKCAKENCMDCASWPRLSKNVWGKMVFLLGLKTKQKFHIIGVDRIPQNMMFVFTNNCLKNYSRKERQFKPAPHWVLQLLLLGKYKHLEVVP